MFWDIFWIFIPTFDCKNTMGNAISLESGMLFEIFTGSKENIGNKQLLHWFIYLQILVDKWKVQFQNLGFLLNLLWLQITKENEDIYWSEINSDEGNIINQWNRVKSSVNSLKYSVYMVTSSWNKQNSTNISSVASLITDLRLLEKILQSCLRFF